MRHGRSRSVGKDNETAEDMLTDYYSDILNCGDPDKGVFWFVLALCEWKKGRLSARAKENALRELDEGRDLERWNTPGNEKEYKQRKKVLDNLRQTLLSPMPPMKPVKKPTVHHCPWKVGSLLAYRIVSAKEHLDGQPCYGKYVLLRVVKIQKRSISSLFDTGYYDESMLVGLYNWIGNELPNSKIVQSLNYIPISKTGLPKPPKPLDLSPLSALPEDEAAKLRKGLANAFAPQTEKCVWLDWRVSRGDPNPIVLLDRDEAFQDNIPDFFGDSISSRI